MEETYSRLACVGCGEKCAHRVCECCGAGFISERKKKYCSKRCTWTAQTRKKGVRPVAEYRASIANPAHTFECEHCGKQSKRNLGGASARKGYTNKWCSMACRTAAKAPAVSHVYFKQCAVCGEGFTARRESTPRCGPECDRKHESKNAEERSRRLHRQEAKVTQCDECGCSFCPMYGSSNASLCMPCKEKRKRARIRTARLMRKLLVRAVSVESVDPVKVLSRDGWRCVACGIDTPEEKRGTYDDDAPEVDHIKPVSKGGEHSYANTQCLCRLCNALKGDRWEGSVHSLSSHPS